MATLPSKKPDIPHFPIVLLGLAILFTFATLTWIGLTALDTSRVLENAVLKQFRSIELAGQILEKDAILKRYVQLGATTTDPIWQTRYNELLPKLTRLINEAIILAPEEDQENTAKKTDLADQQLTLTERQAFTLIKLGKSAEAKQLLLSTEYLSQQKMFQDGMLKYTAIIQRQAKEILHDQQRNVHLSFYAIVLDLILLVTAWVITLRSILSWKHSLEEIIMTEMHYKKEIETARHFLLEMSLINKMNDRLQTCQELKEAYSIISHSIQEIFPDLSGGLCLRQDTTNEMETVQRWGSIQILKATFELDDCWALRESHVYIVNNTNTGLICNHFDSRPSNGYMCLPLIVQNGVIGMLELNANTTGSISDYQQQLAITLSEVLRLSIANIKLRESLNEQAAHDPLTGLYNRRYLNDALPRELQRVIRAKRTLCVVMLDLDYFKKINDAYGHEAGDVVLKFIGSQLRATLRSSDIACRFGGEEFLLILADTTIAEAMPHLQQLCNDIKEAHLIYQKQALPKLTVSIGIAEAPLHANTAPEIIRMADEALYKAKHDGRDRIEIYMEPQ